MDFGVSFPPDPPLEAQVERAKLAEASGFARAWVWDTHILFQECYVFLTLLAVSTEKVTLGTCVTHPVTRDPTVTASAFATLNNLFPGRWICGIGRGDSAVRIRKAKPANLAAVEDAIRIIRGLNNGEEVDVEGYPVQLRWARGGPVPIFVAGYGPKALRLAGRAADGVIFQIADPFLIEWGMQFVREGAEEAGRDVSQIEVQCAAPTFISQDRAEAREQVRWFPALVANHVADMMRHHDVQDLPPALTEYVHGRPRYDYQEHARQGVDHAAYVPDEIVDRFTVIGTVEECVQRLRELEAIGVTEFNIYLAVGEPERQLETYGREIMPQFASSLWRG